MKIVGLSFGSHDSSYAIFENGDLLLHEELERHSRIKECDGDVVKFYIERQGSFDDVDVVKASHKFVLIFSILSRTLVIFHI